MEGILLAEAGLAVPAERTERAIDWTVEEGADATRRLVARAPEITALFCASDTLAVCTIAGLASIRKVPDEVSVVGFDDISIAAHSSPPLTTIRGPIVELGRAATPGNRDLLWQASIERDWPEAGRAIPSDEPHPARGAAGTRYP